jgi:hypothetical protein
LTAVGSGPSFMAERVHLSEALPAYAVKELPTALKGTWTAAGPLRKLYYHLTITLISTVVGWLIGGIEALALLSHQLKSEPSGGPSMRSTTISVC